MSERAIGLYSVVWLGSRHVMNWDGDCWRDVMVCEARIADAEHFDPIPLVASPSSELVTLRARVNELEDVLRQASHYVVHVAQADLIRKRIAALLASDASQPNPNHQE